MPSKLEQLQQQYRRQLLQEKEERMIKIHTESQQKALSKVSRYNGIPTVAHSHPQPHHSPVKKGSPGVDRSRPLPPITKERNNFATTASTRTSPVSAPTDYNVSKIASVNSRSKSVDLLDSRQSPPRVIQTDFRQNPPKTIENENGSQRNGYAKPPEPEPTPAEPEEYERRPEPRPTQPVEYERRPEPRPTQPVEYERRPEPRPTQPVEYERKPDPKPAQPVEYQRKLDPETVTRLKQAELQRLRQKTQRDETPPRSNGVSDTVSKSSTTQRKAPVAVKSTVAAAAAPSRQRPQYQNATAAFTRKVAATPASKPPARSTGAAPRASSQSTANASAAGQRKPPGPGQEQCRVCGRNFNADRIEKHVSVCSKAAKKKVKVFDATKMRVKGTEAEQFVKKGLHKVDPPKPKQSDWRKKRNEFIEAIRQAKIMQQHLANGGKVSDLPPPPPSDTSDYVPCPYCGRKFSEGVAERHIPKCKNILSNKKNPVPRRK